MPHGSDWINYLTALDDALDHLERTMVAAVGASGWTERDQKHLRQGTQALRAAWLEARPEPAINRLLELLDAGTRFDRTQSPGVDRQLGE
jgi:hypothetical protein